jgi:hypothetical protein
MIADVPISLEQIVLKYFRHSISAKDKLFTEEIINIIEHDTVFNGDVCTKQLASILIKCKIGTRSANGNIKQNGIQAKGYSNIIFDKEALASDQALANTD